MSGSVWLVGVMNGAVVYGMDLGNGMVMFGRGDHRRGLAGSCWVRFGLDLWFVSIRCGRVWFVRIV